MSISTCPGHRGFAEPGSLLLNTESAMSQQYSPPKNPSPQYLEDRAWLRAFVSCGWKGMRAVQAADAAVGIVTVLPPKKKQPN